ncbi:hypothetical protein GCM10023206_07990 [Acinetobacter puyangensis]
MILTASSTIGSAKCGFFSEIFKIKSDLFSASVVMRIDPRRLFLLDNNLFKYKKVALDWYLMPPFTYL